MNERCPQEEEVLLIGANIPAHHKWSPWPPASTPGHSHLTRALPLTLTMSWRVIGRRWAGAWLTAAWSARIGR